MKPAKSEARLWRRVPGKIEVVVGPMFSGKSEWMISKLQLHKFAKNSILAIYHKEDLRYGKDAIHSHNGSKFLAEAATTTEDIEKLVAKLPNLEILGIDEIQFFDSRLAGLCLTLQKNGVSIYASGLDLDASGVPWETTSAMMAIADRVEKKVAVCSKCNKINATRTQRILKGKNSAKNLPRKVIGGVGTYEARCIKHYIRV